MTWRVCSTPGCGELHQGPSKCPACTRQYEARRGTPAQRGYDARHRADRAKWQARMDRGEVIPCARCGEPIAHQAWALDHNDDRTGYLGPSHATCNNSAGGKASHKYSRG